MTIQVKALAERANDYEALRAYHRGDVVLRNKPKILAIEGTNFCNVKCIMCPRGEPDIMKREIGHMDREIFQRVLDQAEFFVDPCWLHWFGEPLMNPEIFSFIDLAKTKIPNVGISTNATLLTQERARKLLDTGLDTIIVAIDGATAESYERIRKSDRFSFEIVQRNARFFIEERNRRGQKKPHIILSSIAMQETQDELDAYTKSWKEAGADEVLIKTMTAWGDQTDDFQKLLTDSRAEQLRQPRQNPCLHMWQSLIVAWDGRVVPCCYDYDAKVPLGDLRTQTLEEIWNGPAYVEFRRAELEGRNDTELCRNCTDAPSLKRDPNFGKGISRGRTDYLLDKSLARVKRLWEALPV
ncbi:MAG: radical SAM/SPASM domain-containing protein [Rhodoblastus sp.]